ncbi:hypothetical protein SAMN05216298_2444 [Glycomyces sambucus]|uniref:Uncharacterized protein n=1 Tax=Glycomyces sambucus TaxID=380244 RepID=A0A1G9GV87_9ACTN|nr:hypothetical protein [Glycomyces sambucus]SDL04514.1 hypothetical protein SAMN05216298_2444 [Glycomyces sambucus]
MFTEVNTVATALATQPEITVPLVIFLLLRKRITANATKLVLGIIALVRADKSDIPKVTEALFQQRSRKR